MLRVQYAKNTLLVIDESQAFKLATMSLLLAHVNGLFGLIAVAVAM
jgi:hypothetical protein